ncbi:reticulocalbin-2 [Parasteatoda tepidariorum]|uniref:reticulocalbin-2 n=1 Tax=Parasteatoda tepidariorum TaxID=114398 RepID=UPI00077FB993|nr:reticulocalbin-2 [Parasteatoda tepidariorum]
MLRSIILALLLTELVISGPHTYKSKKGSKETLDESSSFKLHFKDGQHNNEFDHESILGSHNAAEEFDSLSPEESKKRLHALALKMDSNDDGYVDRKELTQWILRSFKMLTEEEALDELEDEDGDEDGKVTWEEHLAETYGMYDDDLALTQDSVEDYQMLQNDKELFKAADLNGDGILNKSEYPAFSHPEEFKHMHQVLYEQMMRKRDVNNDGFLSFEEFIADHHGQSPSENSENYAVEKDRFIHDFDLNNDSKLSKEEVLLWIIPNNVETAENEADHLLESSDVDKDAKLSIKEIVDHHEIFVGSEATDFGEQLHKSSHHYEDEL